MIAFECVHVCQIFSFVAGKPHPLINIFIAVMFTKMLLLGVTLMLGA